MTKPKVSISKMQRGDLPFLLQLWGNTEVMRYADELPRLRGWSRSDDAQVAWAKHQERRARWGNEYTQLILRLDDTPIGESFFRLLPEGYAFGKWKKPAEVKCFLGDVKLLPRRWGKGFGTQGMRQVIHFAFRKTDCELFAVPPHRSNPAATRVYEKVGFVVFQGMRSWRNHKIMELWRARYEELYGP
jgi:RimJ/RimL family protein N-acetyltransferase